MAEATRDAELAARFVESKSDDERASIAGKAVRRAIVAELRDRYTTREVAQMLGISVTRVGQILKSEDAVS